MSDSMLYPYLPIKYYDMVRNTPQVFTKVY